MGITKWIKTTGVPAAIVAFGIFETIFFMQFAVFGRKDRINNLSLSEYKIAENAPEFFDDFKSTTDTAKWDVHKTIPLQMLLQEAGYDIGKCNADGVLGPDTQEAIRSFQRDNELCVTEGVPDTLTLSTLVNCVLQNAESQQRIEKKLIEPYQTQAVRNLMQEAPEILSFWGQSGLFLRPDIVVVGFLKAHYTDKKETDAAHALFAGCANNNLRDAFRHSESVFQISGLFSYKAAADLGDIREKGEPNPLACKLMDIYNHRVAAQIAREIHQSDNDSITPTQALVKGIEDGRLMIYPFPLVRKEKVATTN